MRLSIALVLTILLSACVPTGTGTDPGTIGETTLPPPPAETAPTIAPPDAAPPPAPEPEPEAPILARQRAACAETGGRLMPRARGFYACVQQTRDAGRRCDASADCEGLCLARSGTCAPLHPLFGCQEVFTLPGRRETLCTD